MEKQEILEKVGKKKAVVGEMEKEKINKSMWIALISVAVVAVALIITCGATGHFAAVYAIAALCFLWPAIFYTLQYFLAKRPWQVLIGSVLEGLAFIYFFVRFILFLTGVWV